MRPLCLVALCAFGLAGPASAQSDLLALYDSNGDGAVSRAEFQALQKDSFKSLDTNGDGGVTLAELRALAAERAQKLSGKRMMARDTNGDGFVTQAEFLTQTPGFERADRNNDGVLGPKELARVADIMTRAGG